MSLIKKLAGQTIVYGMGSILPRVLNLIVLVPYLTRVFNDDVGEYGIHGIMYAFAGFIIALFSFRMETALFRFGSKEGALESTFSSAFTTVFSISIVALLLILWQAEGVASVLTKVEDAAYVRYFAFICCFDIISAVPFARLRLENKAFKFSSIKILSVLINIGVMLFFLELLPNIDMGSMLQYDEGKQLNYVFLANLVGSAATVLMLSQEIFKNTWKIDMVLFKKMYQYAWPLVIVGVAGIISQLSDRWLINMFFSDSIKENEVATGLYTAAVKFAVIMQLFTQAFNYAAEPFFFKQADSKDARQTYADVARAFTLVACFAFLFILYYLDILQHLLGENFQGGLNVVPILLLAYLFLGLYYNFSVWYKIKDKTKIGAVIAVIGAVISVCVNIYLIPKIGMIASAWAAFFTFGSMAIIGYAVGRKYYPIPYKLDRIFGMIGAAVLFYFASEGLCTYLEPSMPIKMVLNTALLLMYVGIVWLWEKNFYERILS